MKKFFLLFFSCLCVNMSSQNWSDMFAGVPSPSIEDNSCIVEEELTCMRSNFSASIDHKFTSYDIENELLKRKNKVESSVYLFDNWKNNSSLIIDNKKYKIPNLNYNVKKDEFAFRHKDSVFYFRDAVISEAVINGQVFKTININGNNEIFEVLYRGKKFECLKKYSLFMFNRRNSSIKKTEKFFLLNNDDNLTPFRLSKSAFFSIGKFKKYKKEILQFVKNNNLSFKKEKDIKIIFAYANKL